MLDILKNLLRNLQAIVQNASGQAALGESLAASFKMLLTKPHVFLTRPAHLMLLGVYSGTYIAANFVTAVCDAADAPSMERNKMKLLVVSSCNLTLVISKDNAFAKMFGKGAPKPVPAASNAAFAVRDVMTIFASFNLAPMVGDWMGSPAAAQLTVPIATQFVSAPIHLWALDNYNRPGQPSDARAAFIRAEYLKTALARASRVFPAFSICPLVNNYMRKEFHAMAGTPHGIQHKN
jgi:hypothetical protein